MATSGVNLKLDFDDLMADIKKAGGNLEKAAMNAAKAGAQAYKETLVSECAASGVPSDIVGEIGTKLKQGTGGNATARVGWNMGNYNPKNPSAGYKAVFLNYGTARRTTNNGGERVNINGKWVTLGTDRGKINGTGFIARSKKKAKSKVRKAEEKELMKALEDLKQ